MERNQMILFLMLALFGFLIWNAQRTRTETFENATDTLPVQPAVIQSIINAIQVRDPDVYPIQTVYINTLQGSEGTQMYDARLLFINTRGYFGVQYDVQADAHGRITKLEGQTSPYAEGPFMPINGTEKEYTAFEDIQSSLDSYFTNLKTKGSQEDSALGEKLDAMRLEQRDAAYIQAAPGVALNSGAIEFAEQ